MIQNVARRKGYSEETIKTYQHCLNRFFGSIKKKANEITKKDIENYLERLEKQGKCGSTLNVHLSAIQFYYKKILKRNLNLEKEYSRTPKKLPEFLTQEEVRLLLDHIKNKKHKLMVSLLYASGLRVSELLNLKIKNLELKQNYGWVREGKGKKDRPFIIPEKLKKQLLQWIQDRDSNEPLFQARNKRMSASTIRAILKKAGNNANISKNVHPHMLRHSFATHLLHNNYSVTELQPLLGHSKLETTLIYTHLAAPKLLKIKSPLDSLEKEASISEKSLP